MASAHDGPAPPRGLLSAHDIYLRPLLPAAAMSAPAAGGLREGVPLAGGPLAFRDCEILWRRADRGVGRAIGSVERVRDWTARLGNRAGERATTILDRLQAARDPWPLTFGSHKPPGAPVIMGVVNVTPDSFYAGSRRPEAEAAIERGRALALEGADILDIGGESTRPGAAPVDPESELRRVLPVISALAGDRGLPLSIDTRRAEVMAACLEAGAALVNDVSALTYDPRGLAIVAEAGVPVVLMHSQGEPGTMQRNPSYGHVLLDIYDYLEGRVAACEAAGIPRSKIVLDPGIGFGKTLAHNLALLNGIALFHGLGCRLLVGVSRKSLIGRLAEREAGSILAAEERLPGSLALVLWCVSQGVQIHRVHDVAETRQALAAWAAVSLYDEGGDE